MSELMFLLVGFVGGLVVGIAGGVLVYRKHRDKIEAIRAQAEIVADKLKG